MTIHCNLFVLIISEIFSFFMGFACCVVMYFIGKYFVFGGD